MLATYIAAYVGAFLAWLLIVVLACVFCGAAKTHPGGM